MDLKTIVDELGLRVLTDGAKLAGVPVAGGYASDLLSCVMASGSHHGVWVTLQAHRNVVAVAALLDLAAVILTEGAQPDADTLIKANEEHIVLLSTPRPTFEVVGRLWSLGVRVPAPVT